MKKILFIYIFLAIKIQSHEMPEQLLKFIENAQITEDGVINNVGNKSDIPDYNYFENNWENILDNIDSYTNKRSEKFAIIKIGAFLDPITYAEFINKNIQLLKNGKIDSVIFEHCILYSKPYKFNYLAFNYDQDCIVKLYPDLYSLFKDNNNIISYISSIESGEEKNNAIDYISINSLDYHIILDNVFISELAYTNSINEIIMHIKLNDASKFIDSSTIIPPSSNQPQPSSDTNPITEKMILPLAAAKPEPSDQIHGLTKRNWMSVLMIAGGSALVVMTLLYAFWPKGK